MVPSSFLLHFPYEGVYIFYILYSRMRKDKKKKERKKGLVPAL